MRNIPLLTMLMVLTIHFTFGQNRFVGSNYHEYFDWFHQRSQVSQLYKDQSTLFIFGNSVNVREYPDTKAPIITRLNIGHPVKNIAYDESYLPEDEISGYGDFWYHVKGKDANGNSFNGYVWGAWIAKAWQKVDLDYNRQTELVLLGVSSKPRRTPRDIKAEIRIVKNGQLAFRKDVPGLCLFEDCATSALLRIIDDQYGKKIIEASTITIGCTAGIEKVFLYWTGDTLETVYHAEFTSGKEYLRKTFKHALNSNGQRVQICTYSHEDLEYNPVWNCKILELEKPKPTNQAVANRF